MQRISLLTAIQLFATLVVFVIVPADRVAAGGATFDWDGGDGVYVTSSDISFERGELVRGKSGIQWSHDSNLGTPEDGPYFAYLVPGEHMGVDLLDSPLAHRIAEVVIDDVPYRLGDLGTVGGEAYAGIVFEVPSVPPGDYVILVCNAQCTKPLGDLFHTWFRIDGAAPSHLSGGRWGPIAV